MLALGEPIAADAGRFRSLSRGHLFGGLTIVGLANGTVFQIAESIRASGLLSSIVETFGMSVLVLAAALICPRMMISDDDEAIRVPDVALAAVALVAFLLPVSWPSWTGLTAIALYLLVKIPASEPSPPLRRAGWILLATTGAMFWGRLLLILLGEVLLKTDAALVGILTRSTHVGNTVQFADGLGYLWIGERCSSLSGISLVVLCWTLLSQTRNLRWSPANLGWCLLAMSSVIVVNVTRMALMVLDRNLYEPIHGPFGRAVAGWLMLALIVGICLFGAKAGSRRHV